MSSPIQNPKIHSLIQQQVPSSTGPVKQAGGQVPDFASILESRLKLSGHAQTRLQSRGIELGQAEWERVLEGVERASEKGARESLVLLDDVALVVSVKNRTVITAVDKAHLKENVFTNIDSAVIV